MSETRIDFIRQGYPLWVPVAPRKLPWLPPSEGEGIWRVELAELSDEAMADEITSRVSVYPVIGWRVRPQAVGSYPSADPLDDDDYYLAPVTPVGPLDDDYFRFLVVDYVRDSPEAVQAAILTSYRDAREHARNMSR
jgi:hypothetical protein